ncbi:asparagine synthetase [Eubacterium sp. CAG:274]|jgi:asparagine synthase (glutamine-hydrolysing)|nr:asparagine synthetase [Eubacterium sp. CAG:274]
MCGFCGFTGDIADRENIIIGMMNKIIHRGPDSAGTHSDEDVTMGFRRLSIIGLEDGSQPMYNEDGSIVICFNGEIYNYQPIKEMLIEKGHVFKSHADTEVLIHLYEEKGEEMLNDLRGMFAFAIYDMKNKKLFAARDFFGIKPFYYGVFNNHMLFGSEIKSFLAFPDFKKEVNTVALENYLTFQYSVLDETFFKGVYKLKPGHYLVYKDGKIDIKRYFQPKFEPEKAGLQDTIKKIEDVMLDSVKTHKISDVEVGSFLSSGVDSSFVAATFKGDKTFTVGFDYEKYNEIGYAEKLSEKVGIDNYSKIISTDEYWDSLGKIQYHMDEPLADPSAVALYFVSKLASKHVKVALSGEGADEFFGGYNIYREPMDLQITRLIPKPLRKGIAAIMKALPFRFKGKNYLIRASMDLEDRFIGNAKMFSEKERERILKNPTGKYNHKEITKPYYDFTKGQDDVTRMQFIDLNLWMVGDILLKADKMSMANSLEVRVPFLDKEVFEVARHVQPDYRVNREATKYAFRMAAKDYLPEEVASKKKLGFPVPTRVWLKDEKYYNIVKTAFQSEAAQKYFNTDKIVKYLDDHKNGKADNSRKVWTIYMFLVWYNQFFGNEEKEAC